MQGANTTCSISVQIISANEPCLSADLCHLLLAVSEVLIINIHATTNNENYLRFVLTDDTSFLSTSSLLSANALDNEEVLLTYNIRVCYHPADKMSRSLAGSL